MVQNPTPKTVSMPKKNDASDWWKKTQIKETFERFRKASVSMLMLTEPGKGLLVSNRWVTYEDWMNAKWAMVDVFNGTFTSPAGNEELCWELLVKRGLSSINRRFKKDPGFAKSKECWEWLRFIMWIIAGGLGKHQTIKPEELETKTRVKLIKQFTQTFVGWCKIRRKFDCDFFYAIARGRFGEDREAWKLLKVEILSRINLPKRRRKS